MKTAVIGASGYLGAELLRLLATHDEFDVAVVQGESSAGVALSELYPGFGDTYRDLIVGPSDPEAAAGCEVVFVAVPSGASQSLIPALVGRVGLVVDLGADYRLRDPASYERWYGFVHQSPELLAEATYGLVELNRPNLSGAHLIAAPGCYVTAASLALAPLVAAGVIETTGIIVDAASGTSGAGKELRNSSLHSVVNENFSAYGVLTHRHTPEIEQTIGAEVLFTPHLAPMTRGILATCYGRATAPTSSSALVELLRAAYVDDPFVTVGTRPPSTRETYGSNMARLSAHYDERTGHVVVLSAIDNLTKGGAGQALQAANVALGLPETMGLSTIALLP
jgi:N-acetyl-gamma-glutamyl-phosphate reductase